MNGLRLNLFVFVIGLTSLAGLALAGVYQSVSTDGTIPPVKLNTTAYLNALTKRGNYGEVIDQIELALHIGFDEPQQRAAANETLASLYLELGETQEALRHFQAAVQSNANDADLRYQFGRLLDRIAQGDSLSEVHMDQAIQQYGAATVLDPNFVDAHLALARLLRKKGETEAAVKSLLHVLQQLNPQSVEAHYELGVTMGEKKQWGKAAIAFNKAVELRPDYAEANYNLAKSLEKVRQFPKAREHYEKAIQLQPKLISARVNLARLLARQREWSLAESHFREVLRVRPDDAESRYNMGIVLYRQNKKSEAEEHFLQALRIQPNFPKAREFLDRIGADTEEPQEEVDSVTP